jgi:hypothetical protein
MDKSDQLWNSLFRYGTSAPRDDIVKYIKMVVIEAKSHPIHELTVRRDNGQGLASLSLGETIASKIITVLARQDWLDEESDQELSEILEIAGQLDINSQDELLWSELFEKVEKLNYLE